MTAIQRHAMLRGVIGGDGTRKASGSSEQLRIYQDYGPLVGVIMDLGYFCGHRPSVLEREVTGLPGYKSRYVHLKRLFAAQWRPPVANPGGPSGL